MRIRLHFLDYFPLKSRAAVFTEKVIFLLFFSLVMKEKFELIKKYYFGGTELKFWRFKRGTVGKSSKQATRVVGQQLNSWKRCSCSDLRTFLFFHATDSQPKELISLRNIVSFLPQSFLRGVSRVDSYPFTLCVGLPLSLFIFCNICQFGLSCFLELGVD